MKGRSKGSVSENFNNFFNKFRSKKTSEPKIVETKEEEPKSDVDTLPLCFTAGPSQMGLSSFSQIKSHQEVLTTAELETLHANLAKSLWFIKIISAAFDLAYKNLYLEEKSTAKVFLDSIRDLLANPALLFKKNHMRKISEKEEKYEMTNLPDDLSVNSLRVVIKEAYEKFIDLIKNNSTNEESSKIEAMLNDLRDNVNNPKLEIYNLTAFFESAINYSIEQSVRTLEKGEPIKYREELRFTAIEHKIVMPAAVGFELNSDFHYRLGEVLVPTLQTFIINSQFAITEFEESTSIHKQSFSGMPTKEELEREEKSAHHKEALDKELLENHPIFYAFSKISEQLPKTAEELKTFWENRLVIYNNETQRYIQIHNQEHHKIMQRATAVAKNKAYMEDYAFDNEITFGKETIIKYLDKLHESKSAQIISVAPKPQQSPIIGQRNPAPQVTETKKPPVSFEKTIAKRLAERYPASYAYYTMHGDLPLDDGTALEKFWKENYAEVKTLEKKLENSPIDEQMQAFNKLQHNKIYIANQIAESLQMNYSEYTTEDFNQECALAHKVVANNKTAENEIETKPQVVLGRTRH